MTESDSNSQKIIKDAEELESIERDIAERSIEDPELLPLVYEADDLAEDLKDEVREEGDRESLP